jgi:hypothetical protein
MRRPFLFCFSPAKIQIFLKVARFPKFTSSLHCKTSSSFHYSCAVFREETMNGHDEWRCAPNDGRIPAPFH